MEKELELKFTKLENSRLQLLEQLKHVDTNKLSISPSHNKWSVAQVIYHLNTAESLSTIYVSKKMKDINNIKVTGAIEWFKLLLVKIAFILPFKYKAPAVLGDMPKEINYSDIINKWEETRKNLRQLLNSIPDELLRKNIFKQPAAGRLNIYQMIDFMQAHFNRHKKQIEALIKAK
ncbi:MAG TPA: DinB family protein [Bacteroidia bacterium]|jgi:hypothetical protein|nr:DinB family protein [Bacteroidia bacterium]